MGGVEDLGGGALFDDAAGVHEDDLGGGGAGEIHVVGDDDHGDALGGEAAHDGDNLAGELGVERAGGLVEEQDGGLHGEGAGDGGALLLAAGEFAGVGVELIGEADAGEVLGGEGAGGGGIEAAHDARGEGDVFPDAQVGEEVELLENHPDAGAVGVERAVVARIGGDAVEADLAGVGHDEKIQAAQQGGFSRAAGAKHGGDGAGTDGEGDVGDGGEGAEVFREVERLKDGRGKPVGGRFHNWRVRRHGGGSGAPERGREGR